MPQRPGAAPAPSSTKFNGFVSFASKVAFFCSSSHTHSVEDRPNTIIALLRPRSSLIDDCQSASRRQSRGEELVRDGQSYMDRRAERVSSHVRYTRTLARRGRCAKAGRHACLHQEGTFLTISLPGSDSDDAVCRQYTTAHSPTPTRPSSPTHRSNPRTHLERRTLHSPRSPQRRTHSRWITLPSRSRFFKYPS